MSDKKRYLIYWGLLLLALAVPITVKIVWLADAVARAALIPVVLSAIQYVRLVRPTRGGLVETVRGGLFVVISATVMVFALAAIYVARFGAPVAGGQDWRVDLGGILYVVAAHLLAATLVQRFWPSATPTAPPAPTSSNQDPARPRRSKLKA